MQFLYVALNSKYQKVTGTIDVQDAKSAKEELHKMGLSVLEVSEEEQDQNIQTEDAEEISKKEKTANTAKSFWFLVLDENGKKTTGTIDAENRGTAYRRLVSEYRFQVLSVCNATLPEENREEEGKKGLSELQKQIEQELGIEFAKPESTEEANTVVVDANFEQQRKAILEEMEIVTKKGEEILEKHKKHMSGEQFRNIKNNVDTLMRLRLSNNISYMQQLAEELLTSIQQVIAQNQSPAVADTGYDTTASPRHKKHTGEDDLEEKFQEIMQGATHKKSAKNTMTLGQLKSISGHLSKIAKKSSNNLFPEAKTSPELQSGMHYAFTRAKLITDALLTLRSEDRKQKWAHIREISKKRQEEQENSSVIGTFSRFNSSRTLHIILSELRLFLGWLLSFYVLFFFIAGYSFLKGNSFLTPFFQSLFSTPFLFFFTAFLLFASANISIWHYFLKGRHVLFTLSSLGSFVLYVLYVVNF